MYSAIASAPTDRLRRLFGDDAAGNRTTLQVRPAEVGQTVEQLNHTYLYDHLNRMKQVTQTDVADVSGDTLVPIKRAMFEYNRLGQFTVAWRLSDQEAGGGNIDYLFGVAHEYDDAGRLKKLDPDGAGDKYEYTYDILDRVASFKIEGGTPLTYDYDGNSQLTDDDGTSYTYDENGNRSNYDIGADNRIIDDGTYAYRYDGEGNRIARIVGDVQFDIDENPYPTSVGSSAVTYHYDHRNRLIEVISLELEQAGMTETRSIYTYDVDDRRDYRFNLDETQTATEERIVYDGSLPLVVWDDVNQFYLYGASGEVLAQEDATTGASWPLADHQQSVRIVLDASGSGVAEENDYDAFGNSTNGDFAFRFTHHGGELDRATNLIHMGPRVLDTLTNGFLQQDVAGETTNPYPYGRNSPTNRHDRSGYFSAAHGSAFGGIWGGMYLSPQHNSPAPSVETLANLGALQNSFTFGGLSSDVRGFVGQQLHPDNLLTAQRYIQSAGRKPSDLAGLPWGATFALAAFGHTTVNVGERRDAAHFAMQHPVLAHNAAVSSTAGFMSIGMVERGDTGFWSSTWAGTEGFSYAASSALGTRGIAEGFAGVDIATAEELSMVDRWTRGTQGVSSLSLTLALAGSRNPIIANTELSAYPSLVFNNVVSSTRAGVFNLAIEAANLRPAMQLARPGFNQTLAQVQLNASRGAAFEAMMSESLSGVGPYLRPQVAIRPFLDSGTIGNKFFRIDAFGSNVVTPRWGATMGFEYKASMGASLTPNQAWGYPLLARNGGVVVGNSGGGLYQAGTVLPPTPVRIIRFDPGDLRL